MPWSRTKLILNPFSLCAQEHHLQAALSSTQLAAEGDKVISAKPAYHIPTPESKQVLQTKEYARLYPPGTYQDPISYVRSSSTLEDAIKVGAWCASERMCEHH